MKYSGLLLIVSVAFILPSLTSCRSCSTSDEVSEDLVIPDSLIMENGPVLAESTTEQMMENISSPVETAALIKGLKIPFNRDFIASTKQADKFNTSFEKALALGIYGCDLGYLNMYEKTSFVVDYISVIKRLADDIQVGQFFDFNTLKRLATNNENLDSLVFISQQSFNRIDSYLRETKRSMLSTVIVAGVWVEGAYLSTQVAQSSKHPRIREIVGEQKAVIGFLIALLKLYEKNPQMQGLIRDIEQLKQYYDRVKITYEVGEPIMVEENGQITFKQQDKQIVEMDDETYNNLISAIQKLRNKLIKL